MRINFKTYFDGFSTDNVNSAYIYQGCQSWGGISNVVGGTRIDGFFDRCAGIDGFFMSNISNFYQQYSARMHKLELS